MDGDRFLGDLQESHTISNCVRAKVSLVLSHFSLLSAWCLPGEMSKGWVGLRILKAAPTLPVYVVPDQD